MAQKMDLQILDQSIVPAHPHGAQRSWESPSQGPCFSRRRNSRPDLGCLTPWRYQGHGHSCCLHSRRTHWSGPWRSDRGSLYSPVRGLVDGGPSHDLGAGRNSGHGMPPLSCRCVQRRHVRVKRYHFLEGLSCYWQGLDIDYSTKVRKIPKRFTPFSYRRQAVDAFERLFKIFQTSKIVLSYSSNGYPDLHQLTEILAKTKRDIQVFKRDHTYHFGNHCNVKRAAVEQYLIVGQ